MSDSRILNNRFVWLAFMSVLWGGTFGLIKISARDFEPEAVVAGRMVFAGLTVAPFAFHRFGARTIWTTLRPIWWQLLVLSLCIFFGPTFMLAWAEQRVDSGLAAVIVAGAPIYTAVLSLRMAKHDTVTGLRLVGLFVGFSGVIALIGIQPSGDVVAAVVVALVGVLYALNAILTARWLPGVPPLIAAVGMFGIGSLFTVPLAVARMPTTMPSPSVVVATVVLGSVVTGVGFMTWVYIIVRWGASFGVLANYLVPVIAVAYGALFLDEPVSLSGVLGLALVLAGVALGSGAVGRRRAPVAGHPPDAVVEGGTRE